MQKNKPILRQYLHIYILCRKDAVIFVICGPLIVIYLSNVSVEETNQDFVHVIKTDFCEISGDEFSCFLLQESESE